MELSPMRFKTFIWPHNPKVYSITYERKMAVNKIPFGRYHLQNMGLTRRLLRGEGEFVGEGAYDTFKQLASLFYEETPGVLVHPVWMSVSAWFTALKLEQAPRKDYVRYSFEFWEADSGAQTALSPRKEIQTGVESGSETVWHTVRKGDTLWAIAQRYHTTVESILKLNPGIRNPNLILVGEKVRVA